MKNKIPAILFMFSLLCLWQVFVIVLKIPEYILPKPSQILLRFFESYSLFGNHLLITLLEAFLGFMLGSVFGIFLAILFVYSKTLELALYPYAIALKTIPIIAIAPLLTVWFGNGILPKIMVSAIISFFPVVVNTVKGLKNIDPEAFDLFDSLSATRKDLFFKLRVPSSLPYIFSALKISSTLAVIGALVAEFTGSDKGLGFLIMMASYRLETVDMFVGIFVSSMLGIAFFYMIVVLEGFLVPWSRVKDLTT